MSDEDFPKSYTPGTCFVCLRPAPGRDGFYKELCEVCHAWAKTVGPKNWGTRWVRELEWGRRWKHAFESVRDALARNDQYILANTIHLTPKTLATLRTFDWPAEAEARPATPVDEGRRWREYAGRMRDRNITLTRENLRLQGMVEAYREMLARLQGGQPLDDRLEPRLDGGSEVEAANQGSDGQGGDE